MKKESLISVGYTKKTHGAKGELKVFIEDRYLEDFLSAEVIFLNLQGKPVPYFIENIRAGNALLLKLEGIDSPAEAVKMTSKEISMREEDLLSGEIEPIENEKMEFGQYLGYKVIDLEIGEIGKIQKVVEFPQQEMAIVYYGEKELLVPLHRDLIEKVDKEDKSLTFHLPEGLLDL